MHSFVDLHVHSTASDGRLTPPAVIALAAERKIKLIALTDHDTTAGWPAARAAGRRLGVTVMAGVEINTDSALGEVHLLGYFADPDEPDLQTALGELQRQRLARAVAILEKLNRAGVPLTLAQVRGSEAQTVVTRSHIGQALVDGGYAADKPAAFELYLGRGKPAYVPRYPFEPRQAIDLIRGCGGIVSLAHPVRSGSAGHIPVLVSQGLQAIEVYYPDHTSADVAVLQAQTGEYGLLRTGGSDFHAERRDGARGLGAVWVPEADGEKLAARLQQ